MVSGIQVYPIQTLSQVVSFLGGFIKIAPIVTDVSTYFSKGEHFEADFSEVMGQEHVKRAMEVAATGGHNIVKDGSPCMMSTSTSTRYASMPMTALLNTLASTMISYSMILVSVGMMAVLDGRLLRSFLR